MTQCNYKRKHNRTISEAFGSDTGVVQNASKCLACGDIVNSSSVHDYVECSCGKTSVDGGAEYFHGTVGEDTENLWITTTTPLKEAMQNVIWGTYGKTGSEPFKWVFLNDCTSNHLESILKNVPGIDQTPRGVLMRKILEAR
jgi:hypothetical protein